MTPALWPITCSALAAVDPQLAQAYRVNALRTAQRAHAPDDVLEVLAR